MIVFIIVWCVCIVGSFLCIGNEEKRIKVGDVFLITLIAPIILAVYGYTVLEESAFFHKLLNKFVQALRFDVWKAK